MDDQTPDGALLRIDTTVGEIQVRYSPTGFIKRHPFRRTDGGTSPGMTLLIRKAIFTLIERKHAARLLNLG